MKILPSFTALLAFRAAMGQNNAEQNKDSLKECSTNSLNAQQKSCFKQIERVSSALEIPYSEGTVSVITDGYLDFKQTTDGNIFCQDIIDNNPKKPHQRLIIVDQKSDDALYNYVQEFKHACEGKSGEQKLSLLISYVRNFFKSSEGLQLSGKPTLIGEIPGNHGAICYQYSLLTKLLSDEVEGLESNMRAGAFRLENNYIESHVWNEIVIKKGDDLVKYFIDIFNDAYTQIAQKKEQSNSSEWSVIPESKKYFQNIPEYGVMRNSDSEEYNKVVDNLTTVRKYYVALNDKYQKGIENEMPFDEADKIFFELKSLEEILIKLEKKILALSMREKLYN